MASSIQSLTKREQINFLLTNRIPRRYLTFFIGWLSQIESPIFTKILIRVWQLFADDLRLQDAKKQRFSSLRECFTRQLKDGLRPVVKHPDTVTSPCDAVIGAYGKVDGTQVFQAKGFPYDISELIPDPRLHHKYRNGSFVTLRLKSSMYHRFHAPIDCSVSKITYISGDTWNVNPVALKRVEKLFCKNERAVIELQQDHPTSSITLVPVAAILVASMKFHFLKDTLDLKYQGPNQIPCYVDLKKGDEMGYFQHGSTIILFATSNYHFCDVIQLGAEIKMGQPLMSGHLSRFSKQY
ncbi:archaetidylserine decarboxylase [Paraglaciecola sp.]|uniref:archaetidylserine decarboxylase n=1 Tax=Paraglaciecola sp. TaxID=1920173 RepID=UPI003EF4AE9A